MKNSASIKFIIYFFLFICSCKNTEKKSLLIIDSLKQEKKITNQLITSVKECKPKDTIGKRFSVKYVDSGTFYMIKLNIINSELLLNYKFDCTFPEAYVPSLLTSFNNTICLERSCSNNCRIYYLYTSDNGNIKEVRSFNESYGINLHYCFCVVLDKERYNSILVIDYVKNKSFSRSLRKDKTGFDILKLIINSDKIKILFNDESKQVINFSKKNFTNTIPAFVNADPPPSLEK